MVGSDQRKQDSKDLLSVFLGKKLEGRKNYVLEAMSKTAFRQGDWLMIPPYKGKPMMWGKNIETGNSQNYQLYNLKEDPKQQINLAETNVIKLNELITAYENIVTKEFKSDKVFVRNKKT